MTVKLATFRAITKAPQKSIKGSERGMVEMKVAQGGFLDTQQ